MIVFLLITWICSVITEYSSQDTTLSIPEQVRLVFVDIDRSGEFPCAAYIFERESRWNPAAVGDHGRSWGLGQRNTKVWGMTPLPWSIHDQVIWFTWYADERYGGWCEAMEGWKHNRHVYGWGWW